MTTLNTKLDLDAGAAASETMTGQVTSSLHRMIQAGELGEPMPPERQLGELLGVCRITLRRALAELESSKIIRREQGRGTFAAGGPVISTVDALVAEQQPFIAVPVHQKGSRFHPQLTPWTWRICCAMEPLIAKRGQVLRLVNDDAFLSAAARGKFEKAPIEAAVFPTHQWTDKQYQTACRIPFPWVGLGRTSLNWFWNILSPDWTGALREAIDDLSPTEDSRIFMPVTPQPIPIDEQLWLQTAMQCFSERGITQDRIVVKADGPYEAHGFLATRWYLREYSRPSIVLGNFDLTVVGAYRALQTHDEREHADIQFLGGGDLEIAQYLEPRLSTLGLDYGRIAQTLLDMFDQQKETLEHVPLRYVAARYIRRESSTLNHE